MFSRHTNLRLLIIASCRKANVEPFVKKFSIINRPHHLKHAFISNQKADLFQASNKGNHFYLMNQCNRIAKIAFKNVYHFLQVGTNKIKMPVLFLLRDTLTNVVQ